MVRVPIRSRNGNVVLAVAGASYVVGALVALVLLLENALAVSALIQWELLGLLLAVAASGWWILSIARVNLRGGGRTRAA